MLKKIDEFYKYESFVTKEPLIKRGPERIELDLRKYTKIIFQTGTQEEMLDILKLLKGKLTLLGKELSLAKNSE